MLIGKITPCPVGTTENHHQKAHKKYYNFVADKKPITKKKKLFVIAEKAPILEGKLGKWENLVLIFISHVFPQ